jgi:hypothetical protein
VSWVDVTTAIGTASAAVIALGLGLRAEWRVASVERKERARLRAAQASLVTGWASGRVTEGEQYPGFDVRIRNGNPIPIYLVSLSVSAGVRGTFVRHTDAIGPNETREFRILLPNWPRGVFFAPQILFTDTAGIRWLRRANGELREVDSRNPVVFSEHQGAYRSLQDHPTMRLPEDEYRSGGRIIT